MKKSNKNKNIIILILSIFSLPLFGQNIEFVGGINSNNYHDFNQDDRYFRSSYKAGSGYTLGIAFDDIKAYFGKLRVNLNIDNYNGTVNTSITGNPGGYSIDATIEKTLLSLGLYPLNTTMLKRLEINAGVLFSVLLSESADGTRTSWGFGSGNSTIEDLQDKYSKFSSSYSIGLSGRLAYKFRITENISLTPQYSFYMGIPSEFIVFPTETRSYRHFIGLGIKRKLIQKIQKQATVQ